MKIKVKQRLNLSVNLFIMVIIFISWFNIISLNWNWPSWVKGIHFKSQKEISELIPILTNQTIEYVLSSVSFNIVLMNIAIILFLLINFYFKRINSHLKLLINYSLKLVVGCTFITFLIVLIPVPNPNIFLCCSSLQPIRFYKSLMSFIDAIILGITFCIYSLLHFSQHDVKGTLNRDFKINY